MRDIGKEAQFHVGKLLLHSHLVLQAVDGEEDIDGRHDEEQDEEHVEKVGEGGLPEAGQNLDG